MLSLPGLRSHNRRGGLNTLVIGAGEAGRTLVRALRRSPSYGLVPIGFLDDADGLVRAVGLPVFGPISALPEIARSAKADACVVAIPSLPAPRVAGIIETARAAGLHVRFLPSFLAAVERDARLSDLRQIKVGDLLGRRELHVVGEKAAALISGRRVLVTGAGGSIGSELCRQIKASGPAALYLLDHDESNLHALQLEIDRQRPARRRRDHHRRHPRRAPDRCRSSQPVQPRTRLPCGRAQASAAAGAPPVRGREDQRARHPERARGGGRARHASRSSSISTDKAADPVSVLGATKRLAELLVQRARGRHVTPRLRPFRQRAGQPRIVPGRARATRSPRGRAGDRDPPGRYPVLHDGRGSGGPGARGGAPWRNTARRSCSTWATRCRSSTWSTTTPSR